MTGGETKKRSDKLVFLHKNNVIPKEKIPSDSTINRLYSFYQKNPLDTPLYLAYGLKKRINKNLKTYGSKYELSTPKGTTTARKYVKKQVSQAKARVEKQIDFHTTFISSAYRPRMQRVQDYLIYRYKITANEQNISQVLDNFEKVRMPVIKRDTDIVARNYIKFYKTLLIGAIVSYKSNEFPQGKGEHVRRMGFIRIPKGKYKEYHKFFIDELFDLLKQGFLLVKAYDRMHITLTKVELVFTSDVKASFYERLRVNG